MPTVRLLRTTGLGGYETFNLTSGIVNQYVKKLDLSSSVNDVLTTFSVGAPFVAGTLEVYLEGVNQTGLTGYISENAGLGTFTLSTAPLTTQRPLFVRFIAA